MKRIISLLFVLLGGCAMQHNVNLAPIHVEPIRVQMDVNVNMNEEETAVTSGGDAPDATHRGSDRQARGSDSSRAGDGG